MAKAALFEMERILRFMLSSTLAVAALAGSPVSAQAQDSLQAQSTIIVEGRRDFLRNFVTSLAQSGPTDQLARWSQEVCPVVDGIEPDEARFVESRIVEVAKGLGLRRAGPGCVTTLMITVTRDPAGVANDLVRQYPITLRRDGGLARLKHFAQTSAPVRWISVINECGEGCSLPGSRLVKATTPTFDAMIILVDANQIHGLSIGELSDYVALVALSNPPLDGRRSSRSILSLFSAPNEAPDRHSLTQYDLSFLDGLYASSIRQSARVQRQSILSHMARDGIGERK